MPNPSEINATPVVFNVTDSETDVAVNPKRMYTLVHLGKDTSGAADTSDVFVTVNGGTMFADYTSRQNKAIVQDGKAIVLGPGVNTLKLQAAAGGSPTIGIIASEGINAGMR